MNFQRTTGENTYAFWMQLGQGSQMSETAPEQLGVAVNLKWGGPNQGLATHEGLGYVRNGVVVLHFKSYIEYTFLIVDVGRIGLNRCLD